MGGLAGALDPPLFCFSTLRPSSSYGLTADNARETVVLLQILSLGTKYKRSNGILELETSVSESETNILGTR